VTAGQVYRYPTPQSLHDALTGSLSGGTPLPGLPAVQFHNDGEPRTCSQTVLLTGATGFIGIHLMERLLDRAGIHLVALVRRKGTDTPQARLERVFAEAFPGRGFDGSRVTVLCGDLACPSLGLSAPTWAHIAATVDEIVHCGADVNFLGSPSTLFDANVAGTAELIRLCDEGVPKRLHQISTLAVQRVGAHGDGRQQSVDRSCATGYEYTKHLADELVQRARDQGLRARTYRLDDVLPALETGYPNRHSLIHLFIKACMRHAVVVTGGGTVGLLPVDALAEWICSFVGSADAFSPTPHSMDVSAMRHVALEEIVRFVAGKLGRDVCVIDPASFLQCLACDEDRDAVLLRSMLVDAGGSKGPFAPSTAAPTTGCGSVLDSAQWRRRFAIELEDFSSFVRYVEPRAVEHVGQTTLA
jgi:thioester reductase-like protein